MKMIGNVSDWLSYAGGALIKVADSAGSTVLKDFSRKINLEKQTTKNIQNYQVQSTQSVRFL